MAKATQATRALDTLKIAYELRAYDYDSTAENIGLHAAQCLGEDPCRVLKTLIVQVDGKAVCIILPSDREASMKKVAAAFKGKAAMMMPGPDAERLSGYKIGGVSPFGQRKKLPTIVDMGTMNEAYVFVNGGQRGLQIKLLPAQLVEAANALFAPIVA